MFIKYNTKTKMTKTKKSSKTRNSKTRNSKTRNSKTRKNDNLKSKKKPMEIEFEVKFLDINKDEIVEKLKSLGAKLKQSNTLYKRCMYGLCDVKRGYVRVRDEGDKTTLTAKIYKDSKFPEEYEVQIKDNFENGKAFLGALNLTEKSYHETMREKWILQLDKTNMDDCEIAFDSIPGIPLYVEIECKSKKNLNKAIRKLNLDNNKYKKYYGSYGKCFVEYYDMTENDINNLIPKLTFENIQNELKPYIKKNKDLLKNVSRQHLVTFRKAASAF
jgi:adenylate cyclase class IV